MLKTLDTIVIRKGIDILRIVVYNTSTARIAKNFLHATAT